MPQVDLKQTELANTSVSKGKLVTLFVISLVVFAIALMPISFVARFVTPPPGIAYHNLGGTVWNGQAMQLQVDDITLNNVKWELSFLPLIAGRADLNIKVGNARDSNDISGAGNAQLSLSQIALSDFTLRLPATFVKPMLPIPVGKVGGRVILEINEYTSKTEFVQEPTAPLCESLVGSLLWTKSEVHFNNPIRMGTLVSTLSCDASVLVAQFDGNNDLGLQGDARIESSSKFQFAGYLKPKPHLPQEVHQGIALFSKLDRQGRYPIKL